MVTTQRGVRETVIAWLTGTVPGLTKVRGAKPDKWPATDWTFPSSFASGRSCAAAYVIVQQGEAVQGVTPAVGTERLVQFDVAVFGLHKTRSGDAELSTFDLDDILDGIFDRMVEDPSLAGAVHQAAVDTFTWEIDPPDRNGQSWEQWWIVEFEVQVVRPT